MNALTAYFFLDVLIREPKNDHTNCQDSLLL